MQNKLLPCPFCGGEARLMYYHEEFGLVCVDSEEELEDESISAFIHCYGCSTEVFPHEAEKPKGVVEAWNTRKSMERIVTEICILRERGYCPNDGSCECVLDKNCSDCYREKVNEIVLNGGKE